MTGAACILSTHILRPKKAIKAKRSGPCIVPHKARRNKGRILPKPRSSDFALDLTASAISSRSKLETSSSTEIKALKCASPSPFHFFPHHFFIKHCHLLKSIIPLTPKLLDCSNALVKQFNESL